MCPNCLVRFISVQEPPVPIPNTEVKLHSADNTRWATAREDRSKRTFLRALLVGDRVKRSSESFYDGRSPKQGEMKLSVPKRTFRLCFGK